jgi:DNA helicase-2/ATP-dependent DNA helicase PcrA
MLYGRTSSNRSSRFLDEIPADNMQWLSKPQPRFESMESDSTFGGDRWNDSYSGGYGSFASRAATPSSGWGSGGTNDYRSAHKPESRKPLGSTKGTVPSASLLQLNKGDMVEHTAFGKGMVMNVRPMGGDALVEVAFDNVGTKKLMLKSAGLHMKKL